MSETGILGTIVIEGDIRIVIDPSPLYLSVVHHCHCIYTFQYVCAIYVLTASDHL